MSRREFRRIPYVVEVEFRTASSFLVAYSLNLSRGGIFLETEHEIAVGSGVELCFKVPGAGLIKKTGRVVWRRARPDSGPTGLGVQFDEMDEILGTTIDRLVTEYQGIRVLVLSARAKDASSVTRMVCEVLTTADVSSAADSHTASNAISDELDLMIVDADADGALELVQQAKQRRRPIPVVALTSTRSAGELAREAGADEIVEIPPSFVDFQTRLVRALGRPIRVY